MNRPDGTGLPARWEKCLARPGARLYPLAGQAGRFAVYPRGDRRKRPLARLNEDELRQAVAAGRVETGEAGYQLSAAGHAAIRRAETGDTAAQHRLMVSRPDIDKEGRLSMLLSNALASPLGRFSWLGAGERAAGERFLRDYECSTLQQAVTRNWSIDAMPGRRTAPQSPDEAALSRLAAKDRVLAALEAIGKRDAAIVWAVLVQEDSLAALERRFGLKARCGKAVVIRALAGLAAFYRCRAD